MENGGGDFEETQTDRATRGIKLCLTIVAIILFGGIYLIVGLVSLAVH